MKTTSEPFSFCVKCLMVGLVRVQVDGVGTLARCDCSFGKNHYSSLPCLGDPELKDTKTLPLPVEQFTPPKESDKRVPRFTKEKIAFLKEKLLIAEKFWSDHRNGKL